MTLPFTNDKTRKYQCFVCGINHETIEEYKEHVLSQHEISREFVICPLARCGFPVRCVRTHMKNHHKGEPIPKTGQLKALVWKDINPKTGKLQRKKSKFREGYFLSNKVKKSMHYRSGMECEVYECLEAMKEVINFEVEPFKIQYSFNGEPHEYNPDLSVVFADGHTEVWEIKPANQTHLPKNNAKWTAANQYCETRGYKFMVLTEIGLEKLKQQLKCQI